MVVTSPYFYSVVATKNFSLLKFLGKPKHAQALVTRTKIKRVSPHVTTYTEIYLYRSLLRTPFSLPSPLPVEGPSLLQFLRRCETLWSAREIASIAPSAEQARHAENVFHIALR